MTSETSETPEVSSPGDPGATVVTPEPSFKPIADFVARPDFPECVLGEQVDIGGYTGLVVDVVKQSIKVRGPEGVVRSFKSYGLQRIYGPRPEMAALPEVSAASFDPPKSQIETLEPAPAREIIEEPNFDQPIVSISDLLPQPGFPRSALGRHVEIGGYAGVVVEVPDESLRVRSQQGTSRKYNSALLRKIYGGGKG